MDVFTEEKTAPAASGRSREERLDDAYRNFSVSLAALKSRQAKAVARLVERVAGRKAEQTRRNLEEL